MSIFNFQGRSTGDLPNDALFYMGDLSKHFQCLVFACLRSISNCHGRSAGDPPARSPSTINVCVEPRKASICCGTARVLFRAWYDSAWRTLMLMCHFQRQHAATMSCRQSRKRTVRNVPLLYTKVEPNDKIPPLTRQREKQCWLCVSTVRTHRLKWKFATTLMIIICHRLACSN